MKRELKKANAINVMKENMEKMKEEIITVPRLLKAIKDQDNEIECPSISSLKRFLKQDLNYSYQRVGHRFIPKLTEERYRVMLQFQYILMKSRAEGCKMIYADEFAV